MIGAVASSLLKYQALNFGGGNEYLEIGNFSTYNFERTDSFSMLCWIRWTTTALASYLNKLPLVGGSPERGYDLYLSGGKWGFTLKTSSTNLIDVVSTNLYNDGKWHQLAVTYTGTSLASGVVLYVDGVPIATTVNTNTLNGTIQNTRPFRIGSRPDAGWGLLGQAMDVAVYNKTLTSGEVATTYNRGAPPDLTAVGPTGNLVGYWPIAHHAGDSNLASKRTVYPTCPDAGSGVHNGTMTNMASSDIITRA